mgnify:FL=1
MNFKEVVSHEVVASGGGGNSVVAKLPKRMDTSATGPMAISLETPRIDYRRGGTKLISALKFHGSFIYERICHGINPSSYARVIHGIIEGSNDLIGVEN